MVTLFRHFGLVDNPGPYGHNRAPVPLGIGIVLYLNFASLSTFLFPMTEKLLILIILGAIITGVSFLDDLDTIFKFDRSEK